MAKQEIKKVNEQSADLQTMPANGNSTLDKILGLIEHGADIDVVMIEKMMELSERNQANEARNAFNVAVAAFKAEVPQISKNRTVGYQAKGQHVGYKHVTLDLITNTINPVLSKHGLSTTWDTENLQDGSIKVTCELAHELGHSKKVSLAEKKDSTGSKNSIQSGGSTITYLKRYTLECVTGITAVDDDDDGKGAGNDAPPPPPAFRPASTTELEVIEAICEKLPPAGTGYVLNKGRITVILLEKARDFLVYEQVDHCANQLMEKYADQLHEIDNSTPNEKPGEFA